MNHKSVSALIDETIGNWHDPATLTHELLGALIRKTAKATIEATKLHPNFGVSCKEQQLLSAEWLGDHIVDVNKKV